MDTFIVRQGRVLAVGLALVAGSTGCSARSWNPFRVTPPPPPMESVVLRGEGLEPERTTSDAVTNDLAGAHELFRRGDYGKAESVFHRIAEDKKNLPSVAEEARFYEAESLRYQEHYPKSADTYNRMLNDFPNGMHKDLALQHMWEIANYWLDDTRQEMRAADEKKKGQRWFMPWRSPIHLERAKPLFDQEGRAIEKLEQVKYNDVTGPMADKALFLAGSVKFFREDYVEADHHFSQLVEYHPNSTLAPKAVELAIISKHMSTGGADYDGRKVAEARRLVDTALRSYPELAAQQSVFLDRQLAGINYQQAEKDFKIAEFYRRTGHPGAAYFYYEIVRRRYPGSRFCSRASERMVELREKAAKNGTPIHDAPHDAAEKAPMPKRIGDPNKIELAPVPKPVTEGAPETAPAPRQLPDASEPAPQPRPVQQP